jgi:hypothetical protein
MTSKEADRAAARVIAVADRKAPAPLEFTEPMRLFLRVVVNARPKGAERAALRDVLRELGFVRPEHRPELRALLRAWERNYVEDVLVGSRTYVMKAFDDVIAKQPRTMSLIHVPKKVDRGSNREPAVPNAAVVVQKVQTHCEEALRDVIAFVPFALAFVPPTRLLPALAIGVVWSTCAAMLYLALAVPCARALATWALHSAAPWRRLAVVRIALPALGVGSYFAAAGSFATVMDLPQLASAGLTFGVVANGTFLLRILADEHAITGSPVPPVLRPLVLRHRLLSNCLFLVASFALVWEHGASSWSLAILLTLGALRYFVRGYFHPNEVVALS